MLKNGRSNRIIQCKTALFALVLLSITVFLCFGINKTNDLYANAGDGRSVVELATPVIYANRETQQHFTVYFNESVGNENAVHVESSASISDNILINGKSITEINLNGKRKPDNKTDLKNGITVNVWTNGDTNNEKYGLHFFIDDNLYKDYKIRLDDTDGLVFKKGLKYGDFTVKNDIEIKYYATIEDWKKDGDLIDTGYNYITNVTSPIYAKEQDVYYFCVEFKNLPADKSIAYADYDNILSCIKYNGKSFKQLNKAYGEHSAYVRFQGGEFAGLQFEGNQMYITLSGELVKKEALNDNASISFSKGLVLPSLYSLSQDYTYYYDVKNDYWLVKKQNDKEYNEIKLSEVSNAVYDNSNGSYYIILYFDNDVSFHYLPQVNADIKWLAAVYNFDNPICYYSFSYLQALIYDEIASSVKEKIYINGKSIGELCDRETKIQKDQSIAVNYCGTTFNSKAVQICFNSDGVNAYNPNAKNVVEVKKGFKSPLYGETQQDYKFTVGLGNGNQNGNPSEEKRGCKSSVIGANVILVIVTGLWVSGKAIFKRRKPQ